MRGIALKSKIVEFLEGLHLTYRRVKDILQKEHLKGFTLVSVGGNISILEDRRTNED